MHACMHACISKKGICSWKNKKHTPKKKKSVNGTKEIVQPVDRYHKKKSTTLAVKKIILI